MNYFSVQIKKFHRKLAEFTLVILCLVIIICHSDPNKSRCKNFFGYRGCNTGIG